MCKQRFCQDYLNNRLWTQCKYIFKQINSNVKIYFFSSEQMNSVSHYAQKPEFGVRTDVTSELQLHVSFVSIVSPSLHITACCDSLASKHKNNVCTGCHYTTLSLQFWTFLQHQWLINSVLHCGSHSVLITEAAVLICKLKVVKVSVTF